ncbi:MAG: hypothetical protein DELT_02857 [Desulfovibrio sp.]
MTNTSQITRPAAFLAALALGLAILLGSAGISKAQAPATDKQSQTEAWRHGGGGGGHWGGHGGHRR